MSTSIGKYQLQREIGHGGMGVVWEAHDPLLQRRVAIKLLHGIGASSSRQVARFEREAQAVARIQSPYVVRLYDYGITEKQEPYMVMELLHGETLAQRLLRTRTITAAALLPIFSQIGKALDSAHALGVVHRDLKPANIFLSHQGAEVAVKILDFGLATICGQSDDDDVAAKHQIAGTPPYMSPEQARAEVLDYRTDLWSMAVILYEAFTGQLPFPAGNGPSVLLRICMEPIVPPSTLIPGLSPGIDAFFARALAKDRGERFASASEMVEAFARLLQEESTPPLKILVVDDEPDLALLVEQYFQEEIEEKRYHFLFAHSGIDGLEVLREHPDVGIALVDLRMPGMDGLTFLGKLGAVAPALRAIVISAYSDMSNIRQAMNVGAFDFLIKPLDFADLKSTLEKAVREALQLRRALQSMEENEALRMFLDPTVREKLLPILRLSGPMVGERLEAAVAIIGIDLGSHPSRDARDMVQELNRIYDDLVPLIEEREGAVARFLGDGLLAWFRGPYHGERAVQACMHLRTLLGQRHSWLARRLRIGISAGSVLTGNVGAPSKRRFDYAVFGEAVQTAHVLEQQAQPGQLLIDASVGQTLGSQFRCEPLHANMMRGASRMLHMVVVGDHSVTGSTLTPASTIDLTDALPGDYQP